MKAWWYGDDNFGDVLTPLIAERLCGVRPVRKLGAGTILAVGSILHRLRSGDIVWGTGTISPRHIPKPLPAGVDYRAVRGPHTREVLVAAGAEVPEIYGDPALLLPYLWKPVVQREERIGLIPHYNDYEAARGLLQLLPGALLIDIRSDWREVIRKACSCNRIISSSLHGIILGEAYGIPSSWLRFGKNERLVGGDWKFKDYLASTGRAVTFTSADCDGKDISEVSYLPSPERGVDLDKLLEVCPFNPRGLRLKDLVVEEI